MNRYIVIALMLFCVSGCGGSSLETGNNRLPQATEEPNITSPTLSPTSVPSAEPTLAPEVVVTPEPETHMFVVGDSTVASYGASHYPQTGWGQVLQYYFDEQKVLIENRARGGRSSRSFYDEVGLWDEVIEEIASDDFVLIQFGHNDRDWTKDERYTSPEDFEGYLTKYVNDIRSKGAVPILVSPMVMNAYNGDVLRNVFTEDGNDYRGSMAKVATQLDVAFVDLNLKSYDLVSALGVDQASRYLYLILESGEYEHYPQGKNDGTHFQEFGAIEMSRLVVEGIEELGSRDDIQSLLPLVKHRYALSVENVGANDSIITKSNAYPKDTPLTLKTISGADDTFNAWYRLGQLIEENTILQLSMPASNVTLVAAFNGEVPIFNFDAATVILIGDSTVADYTAGYYPQTGWGQVLQPFFDSSKITIDNRAIGGRSSKSFYNDHWQDVKAGIAEGDFVFIQFGINDRASDTERSAPTGGEFEGYMTKFVNETIALGATPVFISTVRRNQWQNDEPYDAYHEHPVVTRTLAAELGVALIDLNAKNKALLELVGEDYANRFYYMGFAEGEYANFANGSSDTVHFQEAGAVELARLVAEGVEELSGNDALASLVSALRPQYDLDITSRTADAGTFTRGFSYPEGTPITLKALANDGDVFTQWLDVSDAQISDNIIFKTDFSNVDTAYVAVFNNSEGLGIPSTNLTTEFDGTDVVLNWSLQNYDPAITYLEIFRNDANDFDGSVQIIEGADVAGSFVDTTVVAGTTYWYMFKVTQDTLISNTEPEADIRVPFVDEIPVTNLTAVVDGTAVELSWELKYFEPEITYLELYRNDKNEALGRTRIVPGAGLAGTFRDKNLEPGTTYWYMFKMVQGGETFNSDPEAATTIPDDAVSNDPEPEEPTEPPITNLTTAVNGNDVTVTWDLQNFVPEITYLELYRNDKNEALDRTRILVGAGISGEFIDEGLESGKTYWYMFKMTQDGVTSSTDPEAETAVP